jgi:hypothetical protein
VEFKRWEAAARYVKASKEAKLATAGACFGGDSSGWRPRAYPRRTTGSQQQQLEQSQSVSTVPTKKASMDRHTSGHVVEVSCLPKHLMSRKMLEAALEQAGAAVQWTGLDQEIVDIAILSDNKVNITLRSQRAAEVCREHFDGRAWNGPKGELVSARAVTSNSSVLQKSSKARPSCHAPRPFDKMLQSQPAYVHLPSPNRSRLGTSDASTTVSDDEDAADDWEADIERFVFSQGHSFGY